MSAFRFLWIITLGRCDKQMNRIDDVRIMQFLLANPRGHACNTAALDDIRHDDGAQRARRAALRAVRSTRPDSLGATSSLENTQIGRCSTAHASTPYVFPRDALQFRTSGAPGAPSAGSADDELLPPPAALTARNVRPVPGYTGHWRGRRCQEQLHPPRARGVNGELLPWRDQDLDIAYKDMSLHHASAIHSRPEGVAAARRVNSMSRANTVPHAELMRLARGKGQRPARYEHSRGDIPGYGSFSNYIDQAWRLNIDINRRSGKASHKN